MSASLVTDSACNLNLPFKHSIQRAPVLISLTELSTLERRHLQEAFVMIKLVQDGLMLDSR